MYIRNCQEFHRLSFFFLCFYILNICVSDIRPKSVICFRFASAAHPNLELENQTFWGRKNVVPATADIWLQQGRIDFFTQPFVTVHFPAN